MIQPNYDVSIDFLGRLYPDLPRMLTAISPDKKSIESRVFQPDEINEIRGWLTSNGKRNLYYCVNQPIASAVHKKKLAKLDIASVHYLHVDVDPREGEPIEDEQQRILALINRYPIHPTLLVFSGGGYNALWRLETPIEIADNSPSDEETVRRAIDTERRNWQFELDFETPDHCRDVSRILRLPGTVNWPTKEKVEKGRTVSVATIVYDTGKIYPIETFKATPSVSDNARASSTGGPKSKAINVQRVESIDDPSLRELPNRVKLMIVHGYDPEEGPKPGSRSESLFFVCCEMIRCQISEDIIMGVITDSRYGISSSVLDKGAGTQRYALRQIDRARDVAVDPRLAEMNDRYAFIVDFGAKNVVMTEHTDRDPTFVRPSEFKGGLDNQPVVMDRPDKKPKIVGLGSWWLDQKRRRQFDRIVFEPGHDVPGAFNLWRGFAVQPIPGERHKLLLEHIRENICRGESVRYEYLIKWMARVVQQPRSQSMTAIVLQGDRGTGKSIFATFFGGLFGSHFVSLSDVDALTGRFNGHLAHAVFVLAEEAFNPKSPRHESVLKERITGRTINIEYKGVNMITMSNYMHLMMTSNSERVVPAGDKERRFCIYRVRDLQDITWTKDHFRQLAKDREEGGLENLLHYLLFDVDLREFDVTSIPKTPELRAQQMQTLSYEHDWLHAKLMLNQWSSTRASEWEGPVIKFHLYESYLRHVTNVGGRTSMSEHQFAMWLGRQFEGSRSYQMSGVIEGLVRPMGFTFPDIDECRRQFAIARGWENYDWGVEQEEGGEVADAQESTFT